MKWKFLGDVSQKSARISMFLLFGLLGLSMAFFVFAEDTVSTKNIFQDSDQDGLSNDEEGLYGTDPLNKDSDGDGYMDGVEVESGYDPMKPSPGDKLIPENSATENTSTTTSKTEENLTEKASAEIANIIKENASGAEGEVSLDMINESVQSLLTQANEEIILPEVNVSEIKVETVSKKLKGEERKEKEKEQALTYLTTMAYVFANNSPKTLHSENDLSSLLTSLSTDSLSAITFGNDDYLEKLAEKGDKTLKEIEDIKVPEGMLDIHVQAIKMAKYSAQLKDEIKPDPSDPLGQIARLTKVQGLMGVAATLSLEVQKKLSEYGIDELPIDL